MPAHAEVLGNIADGGALDARTGVVPADGRAWRMLICVEAVTRLRGEIDPADERHAVVDRDRLFVVTMQRPFLCIERARDFRVLDQSFSHVPNLAS